MPCRGRLELVLLLFPALGGLSHETQTLSEGLCGAACGGCTNQAPCAVR